jgi:hypothetical protein
VRERPLQQTGVGKLMLQTLLQRNQDCTQTIT